MNCPKKIPLFTKTLTFTGTAEACSLTLNICLNPQSPSFIKRDPNIFFNKNLVEPETANFDFINFEMKNRVTIDD